MLFCCLQILRNLFTMDFVPHNILFDNYLFHQHTLTTDICFRCILILFFVLRTLLLKTSSERSLLICL